MVHYDFSDCLLKGAELLKHSFCYSVTTPFVSVDEAATITTTAAATTPVTQVHSFVLAQAIRYDYFDYY